VERIVQEHAILRTALAVGIAIVAQQRKGQARLRIAEIMQLQLLDEAVDLTGVSNEARHGYQSLALGGYLILQVEFGQPLWHRHLRDDVVHQVRSSDQRWRDHREQQESQRKWTQRLMPGHPRGSSEGDASQRQEHQGHQRDGA